MPKRRIGIKKDPLLELLGIRLRQYRKAHSRFHKQEVMATELGIGRSTISRIENANGNYTIENLMLVVERLGKTLAQVAEDRVPEKRHDPDWIWYEKLGELLNSPDRELVQLFMDRLLSEKKN